MMDSNTSKEDLYSAATGTDDNFFDTSDVQSPEYDNAVNQSMPETTTMDPEERARLEEEWRTELAKLEDDILTLRQVLSAKVRQSSELKRKLGITPMVELKHDLKQGIQNIKESDAYQKTGEAFSTIGHKVSDSDAYQKTNAALKTVGQKTATTFSTFGQYTSQKLGAMRNSTAFKSFEEKIGGAYSNVKGYYPSDETKVRGSQSEQNFEEALNATANGQGDEQTRAKSMPTTPVDEQVPL